MAVIAADLRNRPQHMAQRLIAWAGLRLPIDVEGAARRLGIDIEDLPLSGSVGGMLIKEDPRRWLIVVNNRRADPAERRYTIAHELGHWTLHRPLLKESSLELASKTREHEATQFAHALLMPAGELEEHVRHTGLAGIPQRFGVTTAVAATVLRRQGYDLWRIN